MLEKSLFRFGCALVIAVGAMTFSPRGASATDGQGGGGQGWSCNAADENDNYCCACEWTPTSRSCGQTWDNGNWYIQCGVADDWPCTGWCNLGV